MKRWLKNKLWQMVCPHKKTTLKRKVITMLLDFDHHDPIIEPNGSKDTMLYAKIEADCDDCDDCGSKSVSIVYRA